MWAGLAPDHGAQVGRTETGELEQARRRFKRSQGRPLWTAWGHEGVTQVPAARGTLASEPVARNQSRAHPLRTMLSREQFDGPSLP
jgi:hypothetical protein